MTTLYLSEREKAAVRAIDQRKLDELIEEALSRETISGIYGLGLSE